MRKSLLLLLGIASTATCLGQGARLVFNSTGAGAGQHPFMVFNPSANGGTYLVIDNPATNAVTLTGVTANVPIVKSEREENRVRWATGAATGTYVIPFSTASAVAIPLTVQKTTAGAGPGSIIFSTYNSLSQGTPVASGWDNNTYRPTDVTHMNDNPTGLVNNSKNAIDRFWIIDAGQTGFAYTTKPNVTLTFGLDPAETQTNGGNDPGLAAATGNLVAQRFNSGQGKWHDIGPMGIQASNSVGGVSPTAADFFRSWTLSNTNTPLPIQLVAWDGQCEGQTVKLTWTTASEQDNDYFTIEKSRDALDWTVIGTVAGAGNSSQMLTYSFMDDGVQGLAYYRLRQTDINGTSTVSPTIAAGCDKDNGTDIINAWDDGIDLNVVVSSTIDDIYDLTLMDAQGKILSVHPTQTLNTGITTLHINKRSIAPGIYVVQLLNSRHMMSRRVHVH